MTDQDTAAVQDNEPVVTDEPESTAVDQPAAETEAAPADANGKSDKPKGQGPDDFWSDPEKLKASYKNLQAEFTRKSQTLAEVERQWPQLSQRLQSAEQKAAALEKLASNEKFQAWAKSELLNQAVGEEVDPDEARRIEAIASAIAEKKVAQIRAETEPARRAVQEAQARAAVQTVAEKHPELWAEYSPKVRELIAQYDQQANQDPQIRAMMDNPTPAFVEQLLSLVVLPNVKDVGKKLYQADLARKAKAQVAGREQVSQAALSAGGAKTIADALRAAKQDLKVPNGIFDEE